MTVGSEAFSVGVRFGAPKMWDVPKIRVPYSGILIKRILLFRVLYEGPLFSENPPDVSWPPSLHSVRIGYVPCSKILEPRAQP